ncbi:PAS domain S-box-containing protein [Granulicella aggregans]|uniref:histidine kinase n=1 Tax=Granulicella aggregans TaxID=474949 RepID=A0A7W7ZIT9_9BACT|nr:ATP-binding protein [Granulicella aggregans]MBB5060720.1 PAS domain S-box-containing protein [Granulicella aggregans]
MTYEESFSVRFSLRESDHFAFESNPLPMWIFDIETLRFLRVNAAAVQQYGYSREEFGSMTIEDIRPVESIARLKKIYQHPDRPPNHSSNWKHRRKDGRTLDVDIFSSGVVFEGKAARIVVALDVTERNAAEEVLRHSSKFESLGRLTGGVAHDFNNILAIVSASLELLSGKVSEHLDAAEMLQKACSAVDRGAKLTRSLLAYARELPLAPRRVEMAKVLQELTPLISNCVGKGIQFDLYSEGSIWPVLVDVGQLETAMLNLAQNARDAMSDGGLFSIHCGDMTLSKASHSLLGEISPGEYVVITVADTGKGMTPEDLARATEPFFTTKPMLEATGLGLSMVYGFLRQSGGHLQLKSEPSKGTVALLYLPRDTSESVGQSAPSSTDAASAPEVGECRVVLVVEDEPDLLVLQKYFLESLGYGVLTATDGPSAMKYLRSEGRIDLLLTDVVLPGGMAGSVVAAEAVLIRPDIKILYASGYTKGELIQTGRLPGGVTLLNKPFYLEDLTNAMDNLFEMPELRG